MLDEIEVDVLVSLVALPFLSLAIRKEFHSHSASHS